MRAMVMVALFWGSGAGAQGLPGFGGAPETPDQKRAFCQRVAAAAARCAVTGGLSLDVVSLGACLVRALPPQDSLRVAMAANAARGNPAAVLGECGVTR